MHALAVSAMALAFGGSAQAGASRTFVATTGNDSNATTNCGATTPCRTFGAALSVTNSGGELVVVNSGGYGPATISQPVIITAVGVDASISVTTSGANGLTINTTGDVALNGLNLHGEAAGANGIVVTEVDYLRLSNMLIENFTANGIDFNFDGKLAVYNSTIDNNGARAVWLEQGLGYVSGSDLDNNLGHAAEADGTAQLIVADSSMYKNFNAAFGTFGGAVTLVNDRLVFNGIAMATASGASALYFANCIIVGNGTAYQVGAGTSITGTNPGTSLIGPGQTLSGTLGTAAMLQ